MNDAFGHPQSVVVLGGTSEIAQEIMALLVADRCRTVVLARRDKDTSNTSGRHSARQEQKQRKR